ncbi:MAG: 1-acyl-sn-glycerol-3-phosphate acyltransferase [Phycisphaeraceae bacterium]|nr:1-acyl-sn-glycerol-3-phosphate acyltransferase [Phycisphaeraceae bacterium]
MGPIAWILLALLLWGVLILSSWIARRSPRRDDLLYGLGFALIKFYCRFYHRLRIEGEENLPASHRGPLLVVCNHTAGVDPALVQTACPFEIRWMMAREMMLPRYERFWAWLRIIPVDRARRDVTGAREALRHLQEGGVIGVFPEGGIERPPERIKPFMPGVGLLAAKSRSPVLPVFICGTPVTPKAWGSLWLPSRAVVRFGPLRSYNNSLSPAQIADDLRDWFAQTSGWPREEHATTHAAAASPDAYPPRLLRAAQP